MKKCLTCHQHKSLTEFYRHPTMRDGRVNFCKDCQKKEAIQRRNNKLDEVRKYDRARGFLPHRIEARSKYQKSHRTLVNQIKANWIQRNPEKRKAHKIVYNAIKKGILIRIPCQVCGNQKSEAHHCNYDKPLEVKWLCRKHHHRGIF